MSSFTLAIEIDRSVAEAFAFLADSENTPRWYEAVEQAVKLTPGPVRGGSIYRMTRKLPQGRVVNEVEVSEFEPHKRVTLHSRSGPTPFRYRYTLTPTPYGTHLTLEGTIRGEGLEGPSALLASLAPMLFRRGMTSNLEALKRVLEES